MTEDKFKGHTPEIKYRANFLWPSKDDSIESAGYEFANGITEEYQQIWWKELLKLAAAPDLLAENELLKAIIQQQTEALKAVPWLDDMCPFCNFKSTDKHRENCRLFKAIKLGEGI
jgi:hypothetical protein